MINRNENYVIIGFACAGDTCGLKDSTEKPSLIEVAAVKIENRDIVSHFSSFIAIDGCDAPDLNYDFNPEAFGVCEEHLIGAPSFAEVAKRLCVYAEGCVPIALPSFLGAANIFVENAKKYGLSFDFSVRNFKEVFPLRKDFGENVTTMMQVFLKYDIFLLDEDNIHMRRDILTWALSYARLALALMDEEEDEASELYEKLFSESGVTFIEGLESEREDELALEFCRIANDPIRRVADDPIRRIAGDAVQGGVKVFTDKDVSVFAPFIAERICLTERYKTKSGRGECRFEERLVGNAAQEIEARLENCSLAVLDLSMFSEGEGFSRFRRLSEALCLVELAVHANVNFLVPIHFEKPCSGWRNSVNLCGRHVQVVKLFNDRGSCGLEIFGGRDYLCAEFILLDIETSGLNEERDRVIRVSAEKFVNGRKVDNFFSFVAFEGKLPSLTVALTDITDEMLEGAPELDAVMKKFDAFRGDLPIYADCAPFVRKFLKKYNLEILEKD